MPYNVKGAVLLTIVVFVSQVAGTFTLLPISGFMAACVKENSKGQAAGWYQAGSLLGTGAGGGAGIWLVTHESVLMAGIVLSGIAALFSLFILLVKDVPRNKEKTIPVAIRALGLDIFRMLKVPLTLFVIILIVSPIGTGAAANLWSAIGQDWKTGPDTVAVVTGFLSGVVSALGCVAGGFLVDKRGVWFAYLGSGAVCAVVNISDGDYAI